jgi:hypothetical protein
MTEGQSGFVGPPSPKTMETGWGRPQGGGARTGPSDDEWLAMWEERNRMLQQQGREKGRRSFEERPMRGRTRPMLASGAAAPMRPSFPEAIGRPTLQQRFEGGDLGRPIAPQETNLPGEGVYDWEQRVQQAEGALQNAIRAAGG